jgi:hypothetical protein
VLFTALADVSGTARRHTLPAEPADLLTFIETFGK